MCRGRPPSNQESILHHRKGGAELASAREGERIGVRVRRTVCPRPGAGTGAGCVVRPGSRHRERRHLLRKVVQLPLAAGGGGKPHRDAERWAVLRSWEDPSKDAPSATCESRHHALLWAAALEVASRGSDLAVGARRRDEGGQVIEEWLPETGSHVVGHFATGDPDVEAAMRVLSSLLRIPEALARVVDAGSAPIAELIGRRLVGEQ